MSTTWDNINKTDKKNIEDLVSNILTEHTNLIFLGFGIAKNTDKYREFLGAGINIPVFLSEHKIHLHHNGPFLGGTEQALYFLDRKSELKGQTFLVPDFLKRFKNDTSNMVSRKILL